jgi:hypothetical protein
MAGIRFIQLTLLCLAAGCTVPANQPSTASTAVAAPQVATAAAPAPRAANAPAPKAALTPPKAVAIAKPQATPQPAAAKPAAAPTLDLNSLEEQLKQTSALGVMTKISLKNQVDDLLKQFREYYAGRLRTTLAELRQPYELLLMKVVSLLQDSDPNLAKAIHTSREAIWAVLSDRDKFSKMA